MPKISLISANIGGIDSIYPPAKQSQEFELCYYTEATLPFPLPNLDQRMKGKYLKTQTHRFLDADIFIWVDGSIDIISPDFIKTCVDGLFEKDIVMEKHRQRENVYEELEYIIDKMKLGDRYLLKRYARQPLYLEYEFYRQNKLPKTYPLYQCSFFARRNNERMNKIFNEWWDLILRYSNFDQTQMSFVLWKNNAAVNVIDTKDLFIRNKHIGYNL